MSDTFQQSNVNFGTDKHKKLGTVEATVQNENDISSPVTITAAVGNKTYTLTFDGNAFQSKHVRRVRRNSIAFDPMNKKQTQATENKFDEYWTEGFNKLNDRLGTNLGGQGANTYMFARLEQLCSIGATIMQQIVSQLPTNGPNWHAYGNPARQQMHVEFDAKKVLLFQTAASSNDQGVSVAGHLQFTVQERLGANNAVIPNSFQICHLNARQFNESTNPSTDLKQNALAGL